MMVNEQLIRNYMEGSGGSLIKIQSQQLPGRTEENYEIYFSG
jgi:hypothetical protein